MNRETEIRNITPACMFGLVQILEISNSWKQLMEIVPKNLDSPDSTVKYTSEHVKYVERHSESQRREAAAIFLEEWAISGKNRPKIKHLLEYLKRAQLYRAADFVAERFLKEPLPERPTEGPAAAVTINDSLRTSEIRSIENYLNNASYSSSLINRNTREDNFNRNIIQTNSNHLNVPKIVINSVDQSSATTDNNNGIEHSTEVSSYQQSTVESSYDNMPALDQLQSNKQMSDTEHLEEFPKFSSLYRSPLNNDNSQSIENSNYLPHITNLLLEENETNLNNESNNLEESSFFPNINSLLMSKSSNYNIQGPNSESITDVPHLSLLLASSDLNVRNNESNIKEIYLSNIAIASHGSDEKINDLSSKHIPPEEMNNLSMEHIPPDEMNDLSSANIPPISSLLKSSSNIIPNVINTSSSNNGSDSSEISNTNSIMPLPQIEVNLSAATSSIRSNNVSPLPTLNLKTEVPHFSYADLELATNHFNEEQYVQDSGNMNARKLGSGAFGSVYLGVGLFEGVKVAVKKMHLHGVEEINVDNTVTKQFVNEVELLHKYRHKNLISLLGYSCDGPTYCLVYQYVCGGALGERLVKKSNSLQWSVRLRIASGVAKGVAYLHSAYDTPLIHRDIKSANILLGYNEIPKLCDFGLIKLSPNTNTYTATTVLGTSAYMAPEAFRGDVSIKMDTFSFGVVLLELLTGLPPLDDHREGADLVTHVEDRCEDGCIKPLVDYRAGTWEHNYVNYGQKLFKIANLCLEEKKRRPTMVEVSNYIEELLASLVEEKN